MTVGKIRTLRGPNVWADNPVIEAEVDLRDLAGPLSEAVVLHGYRQLLLGHRAALAEDGRSSRRRGWMGPGT